MVASRPEAGGPSERRARVQHCKLKNAVLATISIIYIASTATTALAQPSASLGTGLGTGLEQPTAVPSSARLFDLAAIDVAVESPSGPFSVGDHIPVEIRFHLPDGLVLSGIETVDPGHLEFIDRQESSTPNESGGSDVRVEQTYVSYRAGYHLIGGFELRFIQPDGSADRIEIPGLEIRVASLIANEQDPALRPEKGGVTVRYRDYTLAWVAGIGGSFIVMALLIFVLARSRPRVIVEPPPPPPRPAHEVAYEKLDAIRDEKLIALGEYMAFFIRVSEAIREYLGGRYGFDGLEMTRAEIEQALEGIRWPAELGDQTVPQFLADCDLVKFAKFMPEMSEEVGVLEDAYKIVKTTTVRPIAEQLSDEAEASASEEAPS